MAQLAVMYRFRVRVLGDPQAPWQPLGDIDNQGTRFIDVMPQTLATANHQRHVEGYDDPQPAVTYERPLVVPGPHRAGAVFRHHEYGSRGVLNRALQGDSYSFTELDNQQVEVAVAIAARPQTTAGFFVFQVANGRSIKTGLESEIRRWLREEYRLYFEMTPTAPVEAVEAAIEDRGVGPVTFRKLDNPAGLFDDEGGWWQDGDDLAVAEYRLKPSRSRRLPGERVLRFLKTLSGKLDDNEDPIDFPTLATFDDHIYDELAVEIELHGRKKTLLIRPEGPDMTHAFSWELDIGQGATDEERAAALAELIPTQ